MADSSNGFLLADTFFNRFSKDATISSNLSNGNPAFWSIAIHAGAGGGRWSQSQREARLSGLRCALQIGRELLVRSGTAINVAQKVVEMLEDNPCFNAGRGSVLNEIGEVSLDASIMDGSDLSCGAIANVRQSKNPIALARAVRDHSKHVLLCGSDADLFGINLSFPVESPEYFKTAEQIESWIKWKNQEQLNQEQRNKVQLEGQSFRDTSDNHLLYLGTVGCVVRDIHENLAAATSTGGLLGKKLGRVGDSPIIGAGTYANNKTCAVSCTGFGELFIKHHVASAISARIEYLKESLSQACQHVIHETLPKNSGGVIAVDSNGLMELNFNTPIMSRGQANSEGLFRVGLDEWLDQND